MCTSPRASARPASIFRAVWVSLTSAIEGSRRSIPCGPTARSSRAGCSSPPARRSTRETTAAWEFPVGTRFWKEFSFDGRKVETRLLWRATAARWVAVSYVWNEAQTDAVLAADAGEPGVVALTANRRHSVPSVGDCLTCHGAKSHGPSWVQSIAALDRPRSERDSRRAAPAGRAHAAHACRRATTVVGEKGSPRRAAPHSRHERANAQHAGLPGRQLRQLPSRRRRDGRSRCRR